MLKLSNLDSGLNLLNLRYRAHPQWQAAETTPISGASLTGATDTEKL